MSDVKTEFKSPDFRTEVAGQPIIRGAGGATYRHLSTLSAVKRCLRLPSTLQAKDGPM